MRAQRCLQHRCAAMTWTTRHNKLIRCKIAMISNIVSLYIEKTGTRACRRRAKRRKTGKSSPRTASSFFTDGSTAAPSELRVTEVFVEKHRLIMIINNQGGCLELC